MRLIDADAFSAKLFSDGFFGGLACAIGNAPRKRKFTIGQFRGLLAKAPTIDPVHAAGGCYCRECTFCIHQPKLVNAEWICVERHNYCECGSKIVSPAHFCSYGKRREGDSNV